MARKQVAVKKEVVAPRRRVATSHRKVNRPKVAPPTTQEDIARLAYSLWEARGCQGGSPDEDWLQAERMLR